MFRSRVDDVCIPDFCTSQSFPQMLCTTDAEDSLRALQSGPTQFSLVRQQRELVGRILDSRFQVLRFVRSDHLTDVFLVSWLEKSPKMVLEAKVYHQHMQLPAVWKAQKRHIKRLGSKTIAIVRDNEYLFLILHPKAVVSTHAMSGFSCDPLHLETSRDTAKRSTCAARNSLTACFNQDILPYEHLFEHLKTVIVTTNHVVLGRDVGSRLADTAANSQRSPPPEDKLREARVQLYQYLKAIATEDKPMFIDCCPKLRKWDSTDAEYRGLLHEFGRVRPYEVEMERIRQACGSTTSIESLECFRQARWEEFIASLALGPSHLTTCAFTSILEPTKQLRLELPKPSIIEESNHEHAPFVLSKTEKQRAKRQRRREKANAQMRGD